MDIKHDAFISYNHGADGRLAKALEDGLEKLAKPLLKLRAIDLFRDETSLAANPGLWAAIVEHLSGSGWMLVLACPQWANSPWCLREALWWLDNRPGERMLMVLTGGELAWDAGAGDFDWQRTTALSAQLRGRFREEPLYVDLRWAREHDALTLRNLGFRDAVLNLSAPIRNVRKDELDGADVRQLRRNRVLVRAGVTAIVMAAAVAIWQAIVATQQRDEAVRQARIALGRQLAAESALVAQQRADLLPLSLLLGIESMRQFASSEADQAIRRSLTLIPRQLKALQHGGEVSVVAVQPGGMRFASVDATGVVRVWNSEGEREYEIAGQRHNGAQVVFSPDGSSLSTVDGEGKARLWDARTGGPGPAPPARNGLITSMAFSPDGGLLAVNYVGGDQEVTISNVASGTLVRSLKQERTTEHSSAVAFGRLGLAAVAYADVHVWDSATWTDRPAVDMPKASIADLSFSPDGALLAVATRSSGSIRVFSWADGRPLAVLDLGAQPAVVAFSPDGKLLAAAGSSDEARIWDTEKWKPPVVVRHGSRGSKINALAFNPSGSLLATASSDHTAALWDPGSGKKHASMDHGGPVLSVGFVADGKRVVTAAADASVRIWEAGASADLVQFPTGDGGAIEFLPRHIVAIDGQGKSVYSFRIPDGPLNTTDIPRNSGPAALSADGQLAVPGPDQVVRIDIASARELAPMAYGGSIDWDEFDRRARNRLSLREASWRRQLAQAQGGRPPVLFSPHGRYFLAARSDFVARVWDQQTGALLVAEPFEWEVTSVAFAPNGQFLAMVKDGTTLVVFALPQGSKVLTAQGPGMRQAIVGGAGELAGIVEGTTSLEQKAPRKDRIRLWRATDWKQSAAVELSHPDSKLMQSPDGELLATGLGSKIVRVIELRSGKERARVESTVDVLAVDFNPDGTLMAMSGAGLRTVIWDLRANRELIALADNDQVLSVGFGPQGHLVTGGEQSVRILSSGGEEISRIDQDEPVRRIRFSPDARFVVSTGDQLTRVSLWRPADLVEAACARLDREITQAQWPAVGGEPIATRLARACERKGDHLSRIRP